MMRRLWKLVRKISVTMLFVQGSASFVLAQPLRFHRYTVEDGLHNNIVLAATQDAKGFLWFATTTGIDRFDGNNFLHYKLPLEDQSFSEYVQLPFLVADRKRKIWAASATDLYRYDPVMDRFQRPDLINDSLGKKTITSLGTGKESQVIIGCNNGFYVYQPGTGVILSSGKFGLYVRAVFEDNKGVLWIGTTRGLHRFIISGNSVNPLPEKILPQSRAGESVVTHISQDYLGRIWIVSSETGVLVYNEEKNTVQQVSIPGTTTRSYAVKDILHDPEKKLTYITQDGAGLTILDEHLGLVSQSQSNEDDISSLSNNAAYDILKDSYGRLWITTYGGGINELRLAAQPFQNFFHEINNTNSLSNNAAKAITEDADGNLWFGTRKGISTYYPGTRTWRHFTEDTHAPAFSSDNILAMTCSRSGWIWAGTYGGGLIGIDPKTGKVINYRTSSTDSTTIGTDHVYALLYDSKDRLWCGGIRGPLSYLDTRTGLFTRTRFMTSTINCLVEDAKGEILAGTEKGVFRIRDNQPADNYFPTVNEKIICILEYTPGEFWLGTLGGGLIIADHEKGVLHTYKSTEGLPSDVISAMLKDRNGDVWVSTSKGIAHYPVQTKSFISYTRADGLAGSQFNYGAGFRTRQGEMIFGSTDGFSLFNPEDIKIRGFKPVILFTGLSIDNKPIVPGAENGVLEKSLDETDQLRLKYNQSSFTVDFINISPPVSGAHLYSWKLEGFDRNWSRPSTIPSAVYTNLNSGKYRLLVKTFSKGQPESSDIRELRIHITPPWWATTWAYLGYFFLLVAGIYAGYQYYRVRITRKRYAEQLKLNTSISHEIRTPLTLIKGPVHALAGAANLSENEKANLELAQRNIDKLEKIISQFIDYQKTGLRKMQMQVVKGDLTRLVNDVAASFVPLMKEKQIHFTYSKPSESIPILFDRDKMEKVLNNLISNAVKYTPSLHDIGIEVSRDHRDYIIHVSDTGIGIPADQQRYIFNGYFRAANTINVKETGSGIGLNVAKELVEMHKGKLEFKSEPGKGTTFTVRLPLQNDALLPYLVQESDGDQLFMPVLKTTEKTKLTNKSILVAEDNDELREYLIRELSAAGYKSTGAANGAEALSLLKTQHTDLVITDVMMPEMNGFQLCTAIKKEIQTCHIPVIMLTAIHDKDYLLEGYRSGADDYVKKPFDPAYMVTRVENLLQNRIRFRNKIMSVFEQDETIVENDSEVTWLREVTEKIMENLSNPDFSVERLSALMAMSRPVLFRKFKQITGESPQQYINNIRLRRAVELLQQRKLNINEVGYECGFGDPKYFSTAFKKQFGKTPREYLQSV